jgi:hypothetical protein
MPVSSHAKLKEITHQMECGFELMEHRLDNLSKLLETVSNELDGVLKEQEPVHQQKEEVKELESISATKGPSEV